MTTAVEVDGFDDADDDIAEDVEAVRRFGLAEFVRLAWSQVDTSPLLWNWHHDAICAALTAVTRREIRDLVINIPPGCSKSLLVSVLWPAWVWTLEPHPSRHTGPEHRWIAASFDRDLALRDSRKMRTLVTSEWYRARWPALEVPTDRTASVAVSMWFNTLGGLRNSVTLEGGLTGKHGDTAVIDDPLDPKRAASDVELDAAIEWFTQTLPTRFRDPQNSARVLVMQRLHTRDPSAYMIDRGAKVLCLPMRYNPEHPHRYAGDPRTRAGELLHPERFPEKDTKELETTLGSYGEAAQFGQLPVPQGGGKFKTEWFQFWTELPPGGTWEMSIDCAFSDKKGSSYVVIQVWYHLGARYYLVDQHRERMALPATLRAIVAMSERYPRAFRKLVEAKANGQAVVDVLQNEVPGLALVEPEGGKEVRAEAVSPLVEARNVYVPHPTEAKYPDGRVGAPWVGALPPKPQPRESFLGEVTLFPRAANDDQVDAMTQFLNHVAPGAGKRFSAAMAALKAGK